MSRSGRATPTTLFLPIHLDFWNPGNQPHSAKACTYWQTLKDKQGSDALWHARHADHRFVSEEQTAEVIRALREGDKKPSGQRR